MAFKYAVLNVVCAIWNFTGALLYFNYADACRVPARYMQEEAPARESVFASSLVAVALV